MRKLLLSIKPKYVEQIIDGTKQVEYRKKTHADKSVEWVLVYESAPVMRIVAEFKIAGVLKDTPQKIWDRTNQIGGIGKHDYFQYFDGYSLAYAYQIIDLQIYDTPKTLKDFGINRAPQSFQYVDVNE